MSDDIERIQLIKLTAGLTRVNVDSPLTLRVRGQSMGKRWQNSHESESTHASQPLDPAE